MHDFGCLEDAVHLIGNIYYQSTTIIVREYFGQTNPIPISRGTIQGDTLSPYLFIIFIKLLFQWLDKGNLGYMSHTSNSMITLATYIDDLVIIIDKILSFPPQIHNLDKSVNGWHGLGHI